MNIATALPLLIALHLTGLVLIAGMTIADMIAYRYFWKLYDIDKPKALPIFDTARNFQKLSLLGALLLILSGVGMMAIFHGEPGEHLWFRIKIVIVAAIILIGPLVARPTGAKLQKLLNANIIDAASQQQIMQLKARVNMLHLLHLVFFATIVILSVFKFN